MTPGPITVRPAEARDDAAVGELLVTAFLEQYARKMPDVVYGEGRKAHLRDVAAKRAAADVWVADAAGVVVGTIALWAPGAAGSEAWVDGAADLRHLAVAASHRGTGLSRRLVGVAEERARSLGAAAVCLHVRRGAVGVRQLYEGLGYRAAPEGDLDRLPEVYLEAFLKPLAAASERAR